MTRAEGRLSASCWHTARSLLGRGTTGDQDQEERHQSPREDPYATCGVHRLPAVCTPAPEGGSTKQAYYSVLASQRLLQVADETVRQNQKHLEEAQARFAVGLAPRFDVTQAQVQLSNAELNQVTARNNVALAHETLRTAMGVTGPFLFTLVDTLERGALTVNDEALVAQAYANRPELQSLQAQQRATTDQVSALRKQYLPSVTGTAQYNWTGRQYPLQQGWFWGVTLTVPLFDDILTSAQVGEAQANLQGLQAQEENLRQQIALEVRQSFLTLRQRPRRVSG